MKESVLWDKIREGDQKVFRQVFDQYVNLLYKYGYKFCQDAELVEDCIQDLFMRIWEKRGSLGSTDSIKFYLMAAVKRAIYRKVQKKSTLELTNQHEERFDFKLSFSIEDEIILQESGDINKQKLLETLDTLSKRQKEIIYLRFYAGLSYEEVGEVMNISYQSVRNLQSTALKKMKGQMGEMFALLLICTLLKSQ